MPSNLETRVAALEAAVENLTKTLTESLKALIAAQERTQKQIAELAEAQTGTEKRLGGLTEAVQKLTGELIGLRGEVGELSRRVGPTTEATLAAVLTEKVLPGRNLRSLENSPRPVEVDGFEVDLAIQVADEAGQVIWVLAETRGRVRARDIRETAAKFSNPKNLARLKAAGIEGPLLVYLGGLRVYRGVEDEARRVGIGLFDPTGEIVPARGTAVS